MNHDDKQIVWVDPKNIVNNHCVRPVLEKDKAILRQSFVENGYDDSRLISVRNAKVPEIESFLQEKHNYSPEKASEVTKSLVASGSSKNYYYCYDGHIRKFVVIDLIEEGCLASNFKLRASVHYITEAEEEIAFSLSRNVSNDFSVPLSYLVRLLKCYDYDEAVNVKRKQKKLKRLSASEVSKQMVHSACGKILQGVTLQKAVENRRHIIGNARKLPLPVIDFFRNLIQEDSEDLQISFNHSNVRSIPKNLGDDECLCLVKRMIRYYATHIPSPKALPQNEVLDQLECVRRLGAQHEIDKFLNLCEYEKLPDELDTIAERMLCTQILDEELQENALKDEIFKPLHVACRNSVPGGTNHLSIAERNILKSSNEATEKKVLSDEIDQLETIEANYSASNDTLGRKRSSERLTRSRDAKGRLSSSDVANSSSAEKPNGDKGNGTCTKTRTSLSDVSTDPGDVSRLSDEGEFDEYDINLLCKKRLPTGWHLMNLSVDEFAGGSKEWSRVQGTCDLVITEIPKEQRNEEWIRKFVRHCGLAMNLTGVCHMFCTYLQFGKIYESCSNEGMHMMGYAMSYLDDPDKTKKLTLTQQPQEWGRLAAVFWKSPDKSVKHHYSSSKKYQRSSLPAWSSCMTNCTISSDRVKSGDRNDVKLEGFDAQVMAAILEQWCKPGGVCYNPRAGAMLTGFACKDLGIRYVAIEEDLSVFEAASRRLLASFRPQRVSEGAQKKRRVENTVNPKPTTFCSIGESLCRFKGKTATFKCQSCDKPMHDLCDWAKVFKAAPEEERELVSVCSKDCFENIPDLG